MFLSKSTPRFRNNGTFPFRGCTMMNTLVSGIGIGVEVTEQFVVHVNSLPGRKLRTTAILGAAVTRKTGQRDPDLFLKLRICSNAAGQWRIFQRCSDFAATSYMLLFLSLSLSFFFSFPLFSPHPPVRVSILVRERLTVECFSFSLSLSARVRSRLGRIFLRI